MIKLIVGKKGSGKTKILVEKINEAARTTNGSVVCIEKELQLTYDISHAVRLVDVDGYGIVGYDAFYGMICGVLAGNYDITDLFIDGTLRIGGRDTADLAKMIAKLEPLAEARKVNVIFTVSCAKEDLVDDLKGLVIE